MAQCTMELKYMSMVPLINSCKLQYCHKLCVHTLHSIQRHSEEHTSTQPSHVVLIIASHYMHLTSTCSLQKTASMSGHRLIQPRLHKMVSLERLWEQSSYGELYCIRGKVLYVAITSKNGTVIHHFLTSCLAVFIRSMFIPQVHAPSQKRRSNILPDHNLTGFVLVISTSET